MHPHPSAAAPAPELSARGRRYRLAGALLLLTLLGGSAWWWVRPKAGVLDPEFRLPALDLSGAEPAVAQAIEAACANVRREPRSGPAWGRLAKLLLAHDYPDDALVCLRRAEE